MCCQLPSCSVMPLPLSLPEKRLCTSASIILLSSFVSDFRLCSKIPSHLRFSQRGKVWVTISLWHRLSLWPSSLLSVLPCFWRQIPSRCQTLNLSNLPPDLRCSSRAFLSSAYCWLCACLARCWLCSCLPAVGYALLAVLIPVLFHLLMSSFFSPLALWLWFRL